MNDNDKFKDALIHMNEVKIIALNYRSYDERKLFQKEYNELMNRYLSGERSEELLKEMNDVWI